MKHIHIFILVILFTVSILLIVESQGQARPSYGRAWKIYYPQSLTDENILEATGKICQLCHAYTDGGDPWNSYGWKLKQLNIRDNMEKAFKDAEDYNSDKDINGQSNIKEINNHKQPGWKFSKKNKIYYKNGTTKSSRAPSKVNLVD